MQETKQYEEFYLEEYKEGITNIKLKRFLEYLEIELRMNDNNCKYILKALTKKDIANSLKYYINANNVNYQITAYNYMTYITKFFEKISMVYNIKNNIFINNELYKDMYEDIRIIIKELNKGEIEIAGDETLQKLKEYIFNETKDLNINSIWNEIKKEDRGKKIYTPLYNNLMSIIPTKLAIEYGLKNEYIHGLMTNDYSSSTNEIKIKEFTIPLTKDYKKVFSTYLEMRDYLVKRYKTSYDDLFIRSNGEPATSVTKAPMASSLFFIMHKAIGTNGTNQFIYKKIIDYIDKGMDIYTISNITGIAPKTCTELLRYYNTEVIKLDINKIFKELSELPNNTYVDIINEKIEHKENKESYMRCPSCGDLVNSNSKNWVIIKYGVDEETFIACKGCKGINEKDYM